MWLNVILGWMQVRQGQVDTGIALMRQGIDVWRATGTMPVGPLQWHQLIEACREVRCVDVGLSAAAEALTFVEESGLCMLQADLYRLEGELYLLRSQAADESEAEACFVQALEMARRQQARLCELRAATSLARLWQRQRRQVEARDLLAGIYGWFTEGFDTPDLQDARALLAKLTAQKKNT